MYIKRASRLSSERLEDRCLLAGDAAGFTIDFLASSELFGRPASIQTTERVDLNGDGRLDLIVGTGDGQIASLFRTENGGFELAHSVFDFVSQEIKAAYVDGDDLVDLIVATESSVTPFLNRGFDHGNWLGFAPQDALKVARLSAFDSADIQGDGHLDLVTASGSLLRVHSGLGDGQFHTAVDYRLESNIIDFSLGDITGDGLVDLAVAQSRRSTEDFVFDTVIAMINDGTGVFESGPTFDYLNSDLLFVAHAGIDLLDLQDLNGDGLDDLLVGRWDLVAFEFYGKVIVGYSNGIDGFSRGPELTCDNRRLEEVRVHDANGDSHKDVILECSNSINAHTAEPTAAIDFVYLGDGKTRFDRRLYNGFAKLEFATQTQYDWNVVERHDRSSLGGIEILRLAGSDSFRLQETFELNVPGVAARQMPTTQIDANGDGVLDVVSVGSETFLAGVAGGGLLQAQELELPRPPGQTVVQYADFNNDGLLDTISYPTEGLGEFRTRDPQVATLHYQEVGGKWRSVWSEPVGIEARFHIVDVNGDGRLDFIVESSLWPTHDGFGWPNRNRVFFVALPDGDFERTYSDFFAPIDVIADFNGDDVPDVAFRRSVRTHILFGDGNGGIATEAPETVSGFRAVGTLRNEDGSSQLLVARNHGVPLQISTVQAYDRGEVRQLEVRTKHGTITDIVSGDFNGDGWQDLVLVYPLFGGESSPLEVYWGNESGRFEGPLFVNAELPASSWLQSAFQWIVADVTGDGIDDILVSENRRGFGIHSTPLRVFSLEAATPKSFVPLPGDLNFDNHVDFVDFLLLAANFGKANAAWSDGDFDSDGTVSFQDFVILATNLSGD